MRRTFVGLAILACLSAVTPSVRGDDREVAQKIIQELKTQRDAGKLKGFTLDMKVDNGVVMFRGQVTDPAQRGLVLKAADGIAGVTKVVDQLVVADQAAVKPVNHEQAVGKPEAAPQVAQATPETPAAESDFSLKEALRNVSPVGFNEPPSAPATPAAPAAPEVAMPSDLEIRDGIVSRLGEAKKSGELSGFGVNVGVHSGVVQLGGRVQREETRDALIEIVRNAPGVRQVIDDVRVEAVKPVSNVEPTALQDPAPLARQPLVSNQAAPVMTRPMPPVAVQDVHAGVAQNGRAPVRTAVMPAQPNMQQARPAAMMMNQAPVYGGAPQPAYPVPGYNAGCGAGGPHYDGPNMPNYAWPGYAAYPNYAALTYPQQYSPSAWPYIGPFYPYPQVPLGWRKVTLEWDDGWWMLDFTDR